MSETKTNKITTNSNSHLELVSEDGGAVVITGSNLSTNADGRFTSGVPIEDLLREPTAVNHLCRKDYVDRHTRIGATVSLTMGITLTGYTDPTLNFGFTHQPNAALIGFPIGQLWTGWVAVTKEIGGNTTHTYVVGQTSCIPQNWANPGANLARVCLTRVS